MEVKVILTELLGDNVNVYAEYEKHRIIAKVSPYDVPKTGSVINVVIPYSAICLFDGDTGEILCNGYCADRQEA